MHLQLKTQKKSLKTQDVLTLLNGNEIIECSLIKLELNRTTLFVYTKKAFICVYAIYLHAIKPIRDE